MKKIVSTIMFLTILVTACTPKQPAGPSAEEVQASAVALAFTISAATMNAIPSATLPPPTDAATVTPLASPTTFVFPTLPQLTTATPTKISGSGCETAILNLGAGGPKTFLLIKNLTAGSLTFSLYLTENDFACGWVPGVSFIAAHDSVGVTVPNGCYYPSAYVNDPKKQRAHSGPSWCIHGGDKIEIRVDYTNITWVFP